MTINCEELQEIIKLLDDGIKIQHEVRIAQQYPSLSPARIDWLAKSEEVAFKILGYAEKILEALVELDQRISDENLDKALGYDNKKCESDHQQNVQCVYDIYMHYHVSQLQELPESVQVAWKLGQKVWEERQRSYQSHNINGGGEKMKSCNREERGWAGHFICSDKCAFRRNTLLTCGKTRIVVSTVGAMEQSRYGDSEIGIDRCYETMAFHAMKDGCYWDADVSRQVNFDSKWFVKKLSETSDKEANDMHEQVVSEISNKMSMGEL